jgi:hypothetical protein
VDRWREAQRALLLDLFRKRGSVSPGGAALLIETLVEGAGYRFSVARARRLLDEVLTVE